MSKVFESGISDYLHFPITVDITFPIDRQGNPVYACEYCRLFTGRRCTFTDEVIYEPQHYIGHRCPLNKEES